MKLLGTFASRRIALARAQFWADELQDRIRVDISKDSGEQVRVWACEIAVEEIVY